MRRMCLHASLGLVYLVSFAATALTSRGEMTVYVSPEEPCVPGPSLRCRRILDIVGISHPDVVYEGSGFMGITNIRYGDYSQYQYTTPDMCKQIVVAPARPPSSAMCFELIRRVILNATNDTVVLLNQAQFRTQMRMVLGPGTSPEITKYAGVYLWVGNIVERASPPTPTKCTAESAPIDFGSINLREINGKTAYNFIKIRCNAETRVTVTFTNIGGGNPVEVKPNLFANLSIYGQPGNVPASVTVPKDQLTQSFIAATLSTTGTVEGGPFTTFGLYRITIP